MQSVKEILSSLNIPQVSSEEMEAAYKTAEQERQERLNIERINHLRSYANLPAEFVTANIETMTAGDPTVNRAIEIAKKYINGFSTLAKEGKGLVFYGPVGTGKTHLSAAIMNAVMNQLVPARYVTQWGFNQEVKRTFSDKSITEAEILRRFNLDGLLVIDEIGSYSESAYFDSLFFEMINNRWAAKRPTIFITNLNPEDSKNPQARTLLSVLGPRSYDRIKGRSLFCLFSGPSRRRPIRTEAEFFNEGA